MRKYILLVGCLALLFACNPNYKKAMMNYHAAAYNTAIVHFNKFLEKHPERAGELNFRIAECYRLSNRIAKAEKFYKIANDAGGLEPNHRDTLLFYYSFALKANEKYEEADTQLEKYINEGQNAGLKERAKKEREALKNVDALRFAKSLTSVYLCPSINSDASDFSTALYKDTIVFTSARRREKVYEGTGAGFHDLYKFNLTDINKCEGAITTFPELINAAGVHDATPTFTADGKLMIFSRSGKGIQDEAEKEVSLYASYFDKEANLWSNPVLMEEISSPEFWDGTPYVTLDGKTLYFASNRPGGFGGLDIYKSARLANGSWGRAENLGDKINTTGNDMFPFIDKKGRLFFASDGHDGLGGLDIFVFEEGKVRNVAAPVNSAGDDFGLMYVNDSLGFFTSNRTFNGAKGDDDIYRFVNDSVNIREVKYFLQGISYWNSYDDPTRKILPETKLSLYDKDKNLLATTTSDASGKFFFDTALVMNTSYSIEAQKEGYLSRKQIYPTFGKGKKREELTSMFTKVVFDTLVVLSKNVIETKVNDPFPPEIEILYEYNKADITKASAELLDKFVLFLNEYLEVFPDVLIEMGSHTDARGNANYNMKLSQRRAESAVNYLIKKGVNAERIKARGYGKSELKVVNAKTEAEHQVNRRTTIKVFKLSDYRKK
jgi:peptidoglycan-associated lipoprotein